MSSLLVTKEYMKQIYAKNQAYIDPILKFLMALVVFLLINVKMGYMERLNSMIVVLVLALFCSFMPVKTIAILGATFMLLHYYALAPECALVVFAIYAVMFLLFLRFASKETIVILLTPIFFMLKIPYVMPIAMGLLGGPASIVSVSFGVIISYLVEYTETNASVITSMDAETMMTKLRFVMDGIIGNEAMLFTMIAFAVTLLIVYTIRRMSVDYAWTIATVSGVLADIVILLIGDLLFDLNYSLIGIVLGSVVAGILCYALQFFTFYVDYKRTENLQFEDDEYYYYVKAVPKIVVATPDKRVRKINTKRENVSRTAVPTTVKTAHGVARTSTVSGSKTLAGSANSAVRSSAERVQKEDVTRKK